ncbi:MAG TPA: acyltransferase [Vitreimonas sp.]|uniref:acyltransferase family protein n=1 Tax=Vitreimonas sp. TaxID=3069702 RepID=UPI002D519ABD|nr:acyltransferase [Vitreimonas sp.]HYD88200.1 acyltransferase [Vitreimonas sp.]
MAALGTRVGRWAGYEGRANALDVGRGIAILSVIYGHALAPWFMGAGEHFSEAAFLQWKFGASFMMVFFFFLSGVGWREDKSLATTLRQALSLVILTLIACVLFDLLRLIATLAGFAAALGVDPLEPMRFVRGLARMAVLGDVYSLTALWFLVALAVVRVIAAVANRFGDLVLIGVGLGLFALTLTATALSWRNVYQIDLLGVAFLAFIAGHYARDLVQALERRRAAAYALLLVAGAGTALTFHLNEGCRWDVTAQCGQAWLGGHFGVSMVIGQFGNIPMFMVTAVCGAAFAMSLSILLARYGGFVGARIDAWGRNSLNLLVVNSLFLHLVNPQIERWVMPRIAGEGVLFFLGLLTLTMALNLAAVHALTRPLKQLNNLSLRLAREALDLAHRPFGAIVVRRALRVSQGND